MGEEADEDGEQRSRWGCEKEDCSPRVCRAEDNFEGPDQWRAGNAAIESLCCVCGACGVSCCHTAGQSQFEPSQLGCNARVAAKAGTPVAGVDASGHFSFHHMQGCSTSTCTSKVTSSSHGHIANFPLPSCPVGDTS